MIALQKHDAQKKIDITLIRKWAKTATNKKLAPIHLEQFFWSPLKCNKSKMTDDRLELLENIHNEVGKILRCILG